MAIYPDSATGGVPMSVDGLPGWLITLLRRWKVLDLHRLQGASGGRSRRSLFRDLARVGYVSSYTHAGRYYTLKEIPVFDAHGLWFYQGIGFSRSGTLKATVTFLVNGAEAGHTHGELEDLLRVRVHNTLLLAVREGLIGRERIARVYLYVSTDEVRASQQVEKRREIVQRVQESRPLVPVLVIEVLVEVVQASENVIEPSDVAARLVARGLSVSVEQVEGVYREHGLKPGKKRNSEPSQP